MNQTTAAPSSVPLPSPRVSRFESMGYGLFMHWGLYSLLGEGEWAQHLKPVSLDQYTPLFNQFTARGFNATQWTNLAKDSGMRYIALTTRHHEGFSLYDTRGLHQYDAPHSPAKRDLVEELTTACNKAGLSPFFYHTTMDWHWRGKKTWDLSLEEFNEYLDYLYESVKILCTQYGVLGGLWFDGNWCRPELDWKLDRLYRMIRQYQPEAMIINNTGIHCPGVIEHPEIDSVTYENQMANPMDRKGHTKYVAGEMCQTLNSHWGRGHSDFTYKSPSEVIEFFCRCRKVGSNYLLNIGPEADGSIPEMESAIVKSVGRWIRLYEKALYSGRPVRGVECSGRDFILESEGKTYYFAHDLSVAGHTNLTFFTGGRGCRSLSGLHRKIRSVNWVDNSESLRFLQGEKEGLATLELTPYPSGVQTVVRVAQIHFEP